MSQDSNEIMNSNLPEKFPFPFEPYPIQSDFMRNLYFCLENKKLGIFESPTGTGKSLSLICGALTWLRDHRKMIKDQLLSSFKELEIKSKESSTSGETSSEPGWFQAAKQNHELMQKKFEVKKKITKLEERENEAAKLKARVKKLKETLKTDLRKEAKESLKKETKRDIKILDENDENAIVEYSSDNDNNSEDSDAENESDLEDDVKIIFASRTHSQLAQFVQEVKRSPFGNDIRVCTLASRQQLCINSNVNKLRSSHLINERCLELKRKSKGRATETTSEGQATKRKRESNSSCPFYNENRVKDVRDISLVDITDIENLVSLGKENEACPYYASRGALSSAQLIVVPYTTLLHKPTRQSCGLKLENSVIIVDEAHNLLDTISSIHSIVVGGSSLNHAHSQLLNYQQKFNTRFSAKTLMYVKQLVFVLSRFVKMLNDKATTNNAGEEEMIMSVNDFLNKAGLDHLNLHKIISFCEKSKLPHKLMNFKIEAQVVADPTRGLKNLLSKTKPENKSQPEPQIEVNQENLTGSPLFIILDFLRVLIGSSADGRVLCVRKPRPSQSFFKYLLLNPAALFEDFVQQPRSVIVAGGTMQPLWEFKFQLFAAAGANEKRIFSFSCGHVIPANHVLPVVITKGPSGQSLDFSFANRNAAFGELSQLTLNLIQVVRGGFVVFFPSYEFEQQVYDNWSKTGFLEKIEAKKKIFREPKKSSEVDQLLKDYATAIRLSSGNSAGQTGAILLSVVGGKLSEGINFSDDLARCVLMIGMPYPNSKSAELKEKMEYLNKTQGNLSQDGKLPGQMYYESLCMKAVNQSIGRAIRHRGDYAALILADARYARPLTRAALPKWIEQSLVIPEKFGPALANIRKFLVNLKNCSS